MLVLPLAQAEPDVTVSNKDYVGGTTLKHVVLSREDSQFEARKKFWSARVASAASLHIVQGDHMSFVREHRNETARVLASLVRQ